MTPASDARRISDPGVTQSVRASVIIVNYNHRAAILRCLQSVLETLPSDCEIVIVDNASSDGSVAAIEASFPQIVVVASGVNRGFGAGCNLGVRHALGHSLVFLNPDTTVEPGWLDALLAPFGFASAPRTGLTTARVLLPPRADEQRRINVCGIDIHISGISLMRGMGQPEDAFPQSGSVAAASGAAFAITRKLFEALGGFDEAMFLYMEDVDLSWRARLAGWECRYVPSSIVNHDYSLKLRPGRISDQERNRYLMLLKTLRCPTLALLLPALALAEVITWGFVLLNHAPWGEKLSAYRWILTHRKTIRELRRKTQLHRAVGDRAMLQTTVARLDFSQFPKGAAPRLAAVIFNPLFSLWRWVMLALVWW